MAITRVNSASINASTATAAAATVALGVACSAGDVIVVCGESNGTHAANGMSVKDSVNGTNFTTISELQQGGASSHWQQTFVFQTPVPLASTDTLSFTPYAANTLGSFSADVFRGATATIDKAVTLNNSLPASPSLTPAGPALGSNATAGALVLTFFGSASGTAAPGSPFSQGSTTTTTVTTSIGFVLGASGASTYSSSWTCSVSNTFAVQTVSLAAAAAATPAAPLHRPVMRPRTPLRARLGRLGLCAAGIASTIVTPLGAQQAHKPPVPVTRPAPHRAHAGPRGSAGAGNAGPQPAPVLVTTAYQRPSPQISRRLPQRAIWRGLASQAVTPRGSPSSPLPRPVIQHLPPDRARLGPAARPAGGIASAAVTPLGSLQAPRRAVIAPPRNARARLGPASGCGDGNIGPSATVPVGAQAYQRPPPQVRRPGPARARLGPAGSTGDGVTGPANAQPAAAVSPPRLPPQTRRPAPARGQWRGNASQIVTPLGTAARRPGPQITSRPRTRALWRSISGTIAPPVTALPKWRPLPSRRKPQRARTGGVLGLANALPPVLQNATSSPAVTAGDTSTASATGAVHDASVTAQGTSAASTTGQPGASTVTQAGSSGPSVSDG